MAPSYRRATEDRALVEQVSQLLAREWDPDGAVRDAASGGDYYGTLALTVVAMLAADARETEIQRYLRQAEQEALGQSLHPFEERRRIAEILWRVVRGL